MPKVVLIHPNAGINWQETSSNFSVELSRRLDNYFEVELLSGAECGSFSYPIKSITRSKLDRLINNHLTAPILRKWSNHPEVAIEHLTSFLPCINYLLNNPVDLILPQNGYGGLFVAACIRAIKKTPILFTEHTSLVQQHQRIQRHLALQPNRLIALNPTVASYIKSQAPNQIVETIPFGIDTDEFTPDGEIFSSDLSKPRIICVGSLEREQNQRIELTIAAVARLPEASLLICGSGSDHNYFQTLGDQLLGSKRFQIKTFPYAQMPQVYRSGSVFTCAASEETGGLKYIEAMACGLPVVTTDDAVRRHLIGKGGITCDVTNIEAYAQTLKNTLERHWYGQRNPRQNSLRFSWQGVTLLYYQAALKTITSSRNQLISNNSRLI